MKVITLYQPYASLVVHGIKCFETRSWTTKHRGRILIHAAQAHDDAGLALYEGGKIKEFSSPEVFAKLPKFYKDLPFGRIIGSVNIVGVIGSEKMHSLNDGTDSKYAQMITRESILGDLSDERFAWKLIDAKQFAFPRPVKGQQRIWNYTKPTDKTAEIYSI